MQRNMFHDQESLGILVESRVTTLYSGVSAGGNVEWRLRMGVLAPRARIPGFYLRPSPHYLRFAKLLSLAVPDKRG